MRARTPLLILGICFSACFAQFARAEVTVADATALGKTLETSIASGDTSVLDAAFDPAGMVDIALSGLHASPRIVADRIAQSPTSSVAASILTQLKGDGVFRFLHVGGSPDQRTLIFRHISKAALEYYEFYLRNDAQGETRIVDVDFSGTGDRATEMTRRAALPLIAQDNPGAVADLKPVDADMVKFAAPLKQFMYSQAKPSEALAVYASLPDSLKLQKNVMLRRCRYEHEIERWDYRQSLEDYAAHFPDDIIYLELSLNDYWKAKQYPQMREVVDQLDKRVGGDPYLDTYRAAADAGEGKVDTAAALYTKVMYAEPTLKASYLHLIELALAQKNFEVAVGLIDMLEANTKFRFANDFNNSKTYHDFMQSPQYMRWLRNRPPSARAARMPATGPTTAPVPTAPTSAPTTEPAQ